MPDGADAASRANHVIAHQQDEVPTRSRLPRSDAQRNHARIVHAARTVLANSQDASLRSIAKEAGVGQGTLYRHFPDRQALLAEVYRNDLQMLEELAEALLRTHPPLTALRLWFGVIASFAANKQDLAAALPVASPAAEENEESLLIGAATRLLDAGKDAGEIRSDVDARELVLLMSSLWRGPSSVNQPASSTHMLDLIIEGIQLPMTSAEGDQACAATVLRICN
ncbi:TetR/AcrR family transcriptional regulator [Mycobacterium cookii]|uniref:TetR/AcrR family transcriptional regulator n=1 Tax=Mycobacterium cookii TaxID=1775 RepID=UPI0013D1C967|nr:TetR/AcrR family transcriptional regulator [Mycobacterium cookii]MCV7329612.1 TetR/AcrR family transcriptional regulator [Mycobacterium cookii]